MAPKPAPGDEVSSRNIQRMRSYYAACMNNDQHNKAGREPLVRQLEQMVQFYPVPESPIQLKKAPRATSNKDGLSTATGQLIRGGLRTIIRLSVIPDINDPTRNLMSLETGGVGLPTQAYANSNITRLYEQVIGEMFFILYATEDPTIGRDDAATLDVPQVWKDVAKDVVAFEKALAELIAPTQVPPDPERFKLFTVTDVAQRTPSLDWNLIFKNALPSDVEAPKEVVVGFPQYFDQLNTLLGATEPKTIQSFFAWAMIRKFGGSLDAAHRRPAEDLALKLGGKPSDRSWDCSENTLKALPDIVSHYFVEAVFPERARAEAEEIINTLRITYTKSFQSYNWLDSYTRNGALDKMKNFVQKIGYSSSGPDDSSPSSIDQFYQKFVPDAQDHFGNQVRLGEFWTQVGFRKLNKKVDRMHMDMNAPTVNAYYSSQSNDINFPAGILQAPMFHVDYPDYLNHGAFGAVVGHEITHGFDNKGRKWDGSGRYRNVSGGCRKLDSWKGQKKHDSCLGILGS